LLLKF